MGLGNKPKRNGNTNMKKTTSDSNISYFDVKKSNKNKTPSVDRLLERIDELERTITIKENTINMLLMDIRQLRRELKQYEENK